MHNKKKENNTEVKHGWVVTGRIGSFFLSVLLEASNHG